MRASRETSHGLEDRLGALRARLARFAFDGVHLTADEVRALCNELNDLRQEASAMARDLAARRWNARAAADPLVDVVLKEVSRPGSNVVLWPVMARPIPGDAPQLGGAA